MLTSKDKKTLRSIAQTRKALFQIGKDGVTLNMIKTISDFLEAHELVKVSLLKTCPLSVQEAALDIAGGTRSEVVQTIGRTVIFYRRSKENKLGL